MNEFMYIYLYRECVNTQDSVGGLCSGVAVPVCAVYSVSPRCVVTIQRKCPHRGWVTVYK